MEEDIPELAIIIQSESNHSLSGDGEAWCATVHGIAKILTQLTDWTTKIVILGCYFEMLEENVKRIYEMLMFIPYELVTWVCSFVRKKL